MPSSCSTTGPRHGVERLDVDTAGPRHDPHLAPVDRAVQLVADEPVRQIGAEGAEAAGRELEVVRLRKAQQRHRAACRRARTERPARRGSARARRARTPGRRRATRSGPSSRRRRRPAAAPSGSERRLQRSPQTGHRPVVAEAHAPAVRRRVGEVRAHLDLDALALEHGQDQLRQPARDDHRRIRARRARGSPARNSTFSTAHAAASSAVTRERRRPRPRAPRRTTRTPCS